MGTLFQIVLYASDTLVARAAADSAFDRIETLNNIFSDYKEDSELNRLSARSGSEQFIRVSPPLFEVVSRAQTLAKKTDGAFDITVGPFVRLWRQMRADKLPELPDEASLYNASQSVGYQYIKTHRSNRSLALVRPDMQLDLGGIAKGYAADEALRILNEFGIHTALVDAGGDITLGDTPPGKEGWRVTIPAHNRQGDLEYLTLLLANCAVATSGDLFQYIEINGKRYSHIIDPRTGLGVTNQSSVTIVAPDGITADSYASAVSVMGPSKGVEFIESIPGSAVSVRVEYRRNNSINIQQSSGFNQNIEPQNRE